MIGKKVESMKLKITEEFWSNEIIWFCSKGSINLKCLEFGSVSVEVCRQSFCACYSGFFVLVYSVVIDLMKLIRCSIR